MISLRLLICSFFIAAMALVQTPQAHAQDDEVSFSFFYDNLSPYGEWVEVGDYGLCWHPTGVNDDWAPYTDGYWSYTDAGWTWVSYEDFGGITYHYGRWVRADGEGWCWVPDTDWGPAWVSWRNNDEYVGWAPLPPEAKFEVSTGFGSWVDTTYDIGPDYYRFCRVRDFGARVIREVCLPRERNFYCVRETVNITNITINAGFGTPFCGGPRYDVFERRVSRPIPVLKLVREVNINNFNVNMRGDGDRRRSISAIQRGNTLIVASPKVRAISDRRAPLPDLRPTRTIAQNNVNRGWGTGGGLGPDRPQKERDEVRDVVRQQTKGATPKTAPARAFTAADVKMVPVKADPDAPSPVATSRGGANPRGNDIGKSGVNRPGTNDPVTLGRGKTEAPATTARETQGRDVKPDDNNRDRLNPNGPPAGQMKDNNPRDDARDSDVRTNPVRPGVVNPGVSVKPDVRRPGATVDADDNRPGKTVDRPDNLPNRPVTGRDATRDSNDDRPVSRPQGNVQPNTLPRLVQPPRTNDSPVQPFRETPSNSGNAGRGEVDRPVTRQQPEMNVQPRSVEGTQRTVPNVERPNVDRAPVNRSVQPVERTAPVDRSQPEDRRDPRKSESDDANQKAARARTAELQQQQRDSSQARESQQAAAEARQRSAAQADARERQSALVEKQQQNAAAANRQRDAAEMSNRRAEQQQAAVAQQRAAAAARDRADSANDARAAQAAQAQRAQAVQAQRAAQAGQADRAAQVQQAQAQNARNAQIEAQRAAAAKGDPRARDKKKKDDD